MSKLQELIKSLRAYTVIIVENDITYEDDPVKLLVGFCLSETNIQELINTDLKELGLTQLAGALSEFNAFLSPHLKNTDLVDNFLTGGYLSKFLEEVNQSELEKHSVFEILNNTLNEGDGGDFVKGIFLKYGINSGIPEQHYSQIIQELNQVPGVQILYYKSTPATANEEKFYSDIKKTIKSTNSNFSLFIIDKVLGTGDGDETGKVFITEDLVENFKNEPQLRFICCLYTSRPKKESQELKSYEDYFIQEISKDSPSVIEGITKTLAQSAYAEVFNWIRVSRKKSIKRTFDIVLKNQKNIKYIIDESHKEGIPSYDAIKSWYDLAQKKSFDDDEIDNFSFIAGLSSLFKSEYLEDHPNLSEIGQEIREINTYELFDYNVNKKYLPIAPGDIWAKDGSYYILLGQLCDMLIRRDKNKRNSRIAELFKIEITSETPDDKYEIKVNGQKKYIYIDNFIDTSDNNKLKSIRIDISTPNLYFADLTVLDLGTFNNNGDCEIDPMSELDDEVKMLLPDRRDEYFEDLKTEYKKIGVMRIRELVSAMDLYSPLDFSITKFKKVDNKVSYGIKRICRLKGRYYDSLYNNYLNNKGRIDLNLIDNAPEDVKPVKLKFNLPGDEETAQEFDQFNLWTSKGQEYFKLAELKNSLANYIELLSFCETERVTIIENTNYDLTKVSEEEYHLTFKYRLGEKKYSAKKEFSFKELFGESKPTNNSDFQVLNSQETISFLGENGHATRTVKVEELKIGVKVFDKKVSLRLERGILRKEGYEE